MGLQCGDPGKAGRRRDALFFARHSRERGGPVPFVRERLKSLDSRVRGNDVLEG
ncbi:hypothetical protein LG3211_2725 [Lysobacter gummosus]|nr:hypothetical protein LG3211_2725 [Lysobacter gummosus]